MITPTQVEQEREKNNRMCTRHKGGKKKQFARWRVKIREAEMQGRRGRRWMWRETSEGQAGFTTGCHGSWKMFGPSPWEKLQDEGLQRHSAVLQQHFLFFFFLTKRLHPHYQLSLHHHLPSTPPLGRHLCKVHRCVCALCSWFDIQLD